MPSRRLVVIEHRNADALVAGQTGRSLDVAVLLAEEVSGGAHYDHVRRTAGSAVDLPDAAGAPPPRAVELLVGAIAGGVLSGILKSAEQAIRRVASVVAMVPTQPRRGRSDPMDHCEDTKAIAERVKQFPWFHSIDLGNGIVTPGSKSPEIHTQEAAAFFDPIRIEGTSVVDVGAWNGFYSFEAKRRGAKRVLATDSYCWKHEQFRGRETFDLARSALGLDIETMTVDVPELSPGRIGTFDIVLFLGVFYHLFDPIDGLRRAATLAKEVLVVETHTDLCELDRPAMVMYPGAELADDATNWWGPNPACMLALLRQFGFEKVDAAWSLNVGRRSVYHAWRSDALRRFVGPKERVIDPVPPAEVNLKRRQKLHRGWRLIREGLGLR